MIITSERLVLRPWQRADLDALAALPPFTDPLDESANWPHALAKNGTADLFFFGRSADSQRREWTITTRDGAVIGHLGIRNIEPEAGSARLGIGLGAPFIGQGYGREALTSFLAAFFGPLRLQRLLLDVRGHNLRARRLYEQLGFRSTGTFWQLLGPAETSALDAPPYAALRDEFRREAGQVLARCIEMTLAADEWQARGHARALGRPGASP